MIQDNKTKIKDTMSKTVNYWVYASWRQNLKLLPQ